jgi:hypothetical protein
MAENVLILYVIPGLTRNHEYAGRTAKEDLTCPARLHPGKRKVKKREKKDI